MNGDWHRLDPGCVVQEFRSDTSSGLSGTEAARRLTEHGPNEFTASRNIRPWLIFLGQFKNVLILILLLATLLSIFLGHTAEAIAIVIIVLFAVLLGFAQEYRGERALDGA